MVVHHRNVGPGRNLLDCVTVPDGIALFYSRAGYQFFLSILIGAGGKTEKAADQPSVFVLGTHSSIEFLGIKQHANCIVRGRLFQPFVGFILSIKIISKRKELQYGCFDVGFEATFAAARFTT